MIKNHRNIIGMVSTEIVIGQIIEYKNPTTKLKIKKIYPFNLSNFKIKIIINGIDAIPRA